jgi:hypothetical protein
MSNPPHPSTSSKADKGFNTIENRFCTNEACGYLEVRATVSSLEKHCCVKCGAATEFRRLSKLTDDDEISGGEYGAPQVYGMCDVEIAPGKWVSRSEWNAKVAETEATNPGKTLVRVDDNFRKLQYELRKHQIIENRRATWGHTEAEVNARDRSARARRSEQEKSGMLRNQ